MTSDPAGERHGPDLLSAAEMDALFAQVTELPNWPPVTDVERAFVLHWARAARACGRPVPPIIVDLILEGQLIARWDARKSTVRVFRTGCPVEPSKPESTWLIP